MKSLQKKFLQHTIIIHISDIWNRVFREKAKLYARRMVCQWGINPPPASKDPGPSA